MFKSARKCHGLIVLLFLAVILVQPSRAETAEATAKEKVLEFVSEVFGLDMTKYNITLRGSGDGYGSHYPPEYEGVAKQESMSFILSYNRGTNFNVNVWGLFLNGFILWIKVDTPTNFPMSFTDPPTDALDESRNILQRYKIFAEKYGFDTSHIDSALTLMKNVTGGSSVDPDLHIFNNITGFVPSVTTAGNMKQETTEDSITWIYTERGIDMPRRCMKIDFGLHNLRFVDTWNLFTVGCFPAFSEDEALRICWEAAKNYNLTMIGKDGPYNPEFEWSNRTFVKLNMVPGQIDKAFPGDNFVSSKNRNPMALYPRWFMVFYFKKQIPAGNRGINGITVGVWGDTKEITSIGITQGSDYTRVNPYVTTSTPEPSADAETPPESSPNDSLEDQERNPTVPTLPSPDSLAGKLDITPTAPTEPSATQPENTPSENPTKSVSGNPPQNMYLIAGIAATAIAIAVAAIALKKRRK